CASSIANSSATTWTCISRSGPPSGSLRSCWSRRLPPDGARRAMRRVSRSSTASRSSERRSGLRVAAVAHAVPSRRMTNAEVVALVREQSRPRIGSAEAERVCDLVASFLEGAGTDVRYRLADDEKAIDVVLRASRGALAEAGVAPDDVDLVLYTGV